MRLKTSDLKTTLSEIRSVWEGVFPYHVFEYRFLDEDIARFYDSEMRNSYIMATFAAMAVLICCIGLFGLVSFMVQQKVKEIGIRKTFGASVSQIIHLLSREFIMLIFVSFVFSVPVVYYFMEKWLSNFAYAIDITVIDFSIGLLSIFLISILTVGYRSVRAAMANPVDTLRTE